MIYAKSYLQKGKRTGETLEEHTKNLLEGLKTLELFYRKEIDNIGLRDDFWELLCFACLFHDLGKVSTPFQEKIRNFLEGKPASNTAKKEVPHNYLSIAFLKNLGHWNLDQESLTLLLYAIAFHHYRPINFSEDYLKKSIKEDLSIKITELQWTEEFGIKINELYDGYYGYLNENVNIYRNIRKNKNYIILKGLLHRLDHSASAHLPVEEKRIINPEDKLITYLKSKSNFSGLKPFQEKAKDLRDKSVLLTASTGMGKTEFAINWIGSDKAFYTLPLRVSVNAMYKRFSDIFRDDTVGTLHSDSLFYGLEELEKENNSNDSSIEEHIHQVNITRQLSMPITITTADQLFTSVFKWKGYEKIYATLAYSKVVVDEPQSYSADILAFIIKSLQEIAELGSRFCVMSATVHPFLKKYLYNYCEFLEPVYNQEKKHKIKLEDCSIDDLIPEIVKAYEKGKKVLVILNTVKKCQEIFCKLRDLCRVNLLHSGLILKDRRIREEKVKEDFERKEPVVWITTQIVEASLDIDYDILFTEISTLDSIIQRMGRIYRRTGRVIADKDEPNIIIAALSPSDEFFIYDEEIVNFTRLALEEFDHRVITEEDKQRLINWVFNPDRIRNTKFYNKFYQAFKLLENGFEAENRMEAQRLFRNIANLTVIPKPIYCKNHEEIDECLSGILEKNLSLSKRLLLIKSLNDFTVSVPVYKSRGKELVSIDRKRGIYVLQVEYNEEMGLLSGKVSKDFSNII